MIQISVLNAQGVAGDSLQLGANVERKEMSPKTFACAIRLLLQNWRQGTVGCKTRGQLAFSNKKPWRQKGTGRARVSSIRSPLWRKGGVIFGPQPRVRELAMNASQRRLVMNNLFFSMIDNSKIHCLDFSVSNAKPDTKGAFQAIEKAGFNDRKIVLFLPFGDDLTYTSFRNIPNVSIVLFDEPNAYQLSNGDCWVFLKKDVDSFKVMVERWN